MFSVILLLEKEVRQMTFWGEINRKYILNIQLFLWILYGKLIFFHAEVAYKVKVLFIDCEIFMQT